MSEKTKTKLIGATLGLIILAMGVGAAFVTFSDSPWFVRVVTGLATVVYGWVGMKCFTAVFS